MATKHINDELWHRIEVLTVRANARQNLIRPVKEATCFIWFCSVAWSALHRRRSAAAGRTAGP